MKNHAESLPLVSVYIPTKNRAEMLKRAIDSVLAQTYKNLEIVVSDDGSTDETPDVMRVYCEAHNNIKYIRSSVSEGACAARNKAIMAATGEFITGLDDDDRFTPERVSSFIDNWAPRISFLCTLGCTYDGKNYHKSRYYNKTIKYAQQVRRNYVGTQIFTKTAYLKEHKIFFDERFPAWQDYDLFTRLLLELGPAKRVMKRTYIQHTDHEQGRITNPRRILKGYRLFLAKNKKNMSKSQRASLIINANILRDHQVGIHFVYKCIKLGNLWDAVKVLKKQKLGL